MTQKSQQTEANELLACMIKDLYTSQQGKFSKATAIKAMKFVGGNLELQKLANIGDFTKFKKQIVVELEKNKA